MLLVGLGIMRAGGLHNPNGTTELLDAKMSCSEPQKPSRSRTKGLCSYRRLKA